MCQNISEGALSSNIDIDCYATIRKDSDVPYDIQWEQNCHCGDLVEHTGLVPLCWHFKVMLYHKEMF